MFFCPNCDNILSIIQESGNHNTISQNIYETPVTVSNSEQELSTQVKSKNDIQDITISKAYFKCPNCGYTELIKPETLILSKAPEKTTSGYIKDLSIYKDMVNDETLPHTHNYVCPNKECTSHSNYKERESVWFKPYRDSYITIIICKACHTIYQA